MTRPWRTLLRSYVSSSRLAPGGEIGTDEAHAPLPLAADARLVPVAATAWLVAWAAPLVSVPRASAAAVAMGLVGAVALVLAWRGGTAWHGVAAAALLAAAAVAGVAAFRVATARGSIVDDLAAEQATVTADVRVTGDARRVTVPNAVLWVVPADVVHIAGRGQNATARAPVVVLAQDRAWGDLLPSTVVRVSGRLAPNDRVGREVGVLTARGPPGEIVVDASTVQRVAGKLREGLRTAVADLPEDPRGLVPGLVVGDESRVPDDLTADVKTAGLTHLTAVSGTNVAIVLAFVLGTARLIGVRGWLLRAVGLLAIVGFVILARPQPSVLRAAAMGALAVWTLGAARSRSLAALTVAVVALLLADPWLARSYGFALSVLATAAIVLFVPPWAARLERWMPRRLAEALVVPLAAQLVCAPLIVLLSSSVSLVAVLANVLAAPAVAPATIAGVVLTVVGAGAPSVAAALAWAAGLPAAWIAWVAHWTAGLPNATVPWPGGVWSAVALAVLTVAGWLVARGLVRRSRAAIVLTVLAVMAYGAWRVIVPGWPPADWQFVACDVGQGDALVLRVADAAAVVVDVGPEPATIDRCLRQLGVAAVPVLVLTHSDADHIGGLAGAVRHRLVGRIVVAPAAWEPTKLPGLVDVASDIGAQIVTIGAGDVIAVGLARLDVLWPPRDARAAVEGAPVNDASIVVRAQLGTGVSALLTGDLGPVGQAELLATGAGVRADVLKVPHHGSRFQDARFLAAVGASVAVVSVGADNDYGHPTAYTLGLLADDGMTLWRTDRSGGLALRAADTPAGAAIQVFPARGPAGAALTGAARGPPVQAPHSTARRPRRQ